MLIKYTHLPAGLAWLGVLNAVLTRPISSRHRLGRRETRRRRPLGAVLLVLALLALLISSSLIGAPGHAARPHTRVPLWGVQLCACELRDRSWLRHSRASLPELVLKGDR